MLFKNLLRRMPEQTGQQGKFPSGFRQTNFEKWRETLTPEEIFTNYGIFGFCGKECPATEYCRSGKSQHLDAYQHNWECREVFFEWANKEAAL
jgi:hypothetical protein